MSGELWQERFQVGKEVTPSTGVPATRVVYGTGSIRPNYHVSRQEVDTGTRDRVVQSVSGAVEVSGTIQQPLSAPEFLEWLLIGVKGGVSPTSQASPTPTVDPTVGVAGTDGTLPAGVYTVAYTITTPAGESQKKTVTATATITGAHEHIVVGAVTPLAAGGTLVTYYVSTAGGGTTTVTKAVTNTTGATINILNPGDGTTVPPIATPTPVQTWVFVPGTLDSSTVEWNDGARNWQAMGVRANQLTITGNPKPDGENMMSAALFGTGQIVNAATGSLVDRVPLWTRGWEAKLYIDAFGATPGTTNLAGILLDWQITFGNNLGRKYTGDNQQNASAVIAGNMEAQLQMKLEASAAATLTEYNNYVSGIKRIARLEFGNNIPIGTGTAKHKVMVDIPLGWTDADITQDDAGTRAYQFTGGYVRDVTNGFPFRVTVVCDRAAAFA